MDKLRALSQPLLSLSSVPDTPVGARLRSFASVWSSQLHLPRWHQRTLQLGLSWNWTSRPPLTDSPIPIKLPANTVQRNVLLSEINVLVEKNALVPVVCPDPGFYSQVFVVPKRTGGFRPVIDLKALNRHIACPTFRMETPQSIRRQLQVGEVTTSIDLADAYLHIPVDPEFQRYLRIAVGNQVWQFQAMPFGLNLAPRAFTQLLTPVAAALRAQGIKIHRYLDDWLIRSPSIQAAQAHTQQVLNLFQRLGLLVRLEKSDLEPKATFVFLGLHFNLHNGTVAPPGDKIQAVVQLVRSVCTQSHIRIRLLLRLIGILNHLADYVPLGRLRLRPVQFYLLSLHVDLRQDFDRRVPIRPGLRLALQPWLDRHWLGARVALRSPPPTLTIATDASLVGWGAHIGDRLLAGRWTPPETALHISVLELRAIRRALEELQTTVEHQSVRIMTDSMVAAAYIRREGGTKSLSLFKEVRDLLLWCQDHHVHLTPHFLPGHLNVLADLQSRPHQVLSTEWTLQARVFSRLQVHFPWMAIDLFATRLNHQLPQFVSPFPDPQAVDSDALTMAWDGLQAYAFPPIAIITEVLHKVAQSDMSCVLLAPWWPAQAWFPEALRLLMGAPVQLPHYRRLLSQPHRVLYHHNPAWLNLHAWPLSGNGSVRRAFQTRLRTLRQATCGPVLPASTNPTGGPSAPGVSNTAWIPCIPL